MRREDIQEDGQNAAGKEPTEDAPKEPAGEQESTAKLNRRRFLLAGSGTAAALLTAPYTLSNAQQRKTSGRSGQTRTASALSEQSTYSFQPYREPETAEARVARGAGESLLPLTLTAGMTDWTFSCNNQTSKAKIPIYNHHVPGVTLVVDPGSRLELTVVNNLNTSFPGDKCTMHTIHAAEMQGEQAACPPTPPPSPSPTPAPFSSAPKPGCFSHTNLHAHGLMVSPCSVDKTGSIRCGATTSDKLAFSSDDVLVDIPPGGSNNYRIVLPDFHAPGTHWYHSHLHGASGYQVSSGMAGAIIVREPVGQELVQADRDKVFLMQEVIFGQEGDFPTVYTIRGKVNTAGFLINGVCKPTLQIPLGQTQRWRFINATGTPRGLMKLRLVKCANNNCDGSQVPPPPTPSNPDQLMYLIAVDGISFYGFPPQPVRAHLMGAGNRADFLVNFSQPGRYLVVKDAFPKDAVTVSDFTNVIGPTKDTSQVLAIVDVTQSGGTPDPIPATIPGERPQYLLPIGSVDKSGRTVTFFADHVSGQPANVLGGRFQIDNNYYPCNRDLVAPLNTAEEITIGNTGTGAMPHPFHIHVNPFQMVGRTLDFEVAQADRQPNNPPMQNIPANWMWMDTIALPPAGAKIRTRFLVYNGEFVSHCHILIHEDVGMMINVKIDGNGVGPGQPLRDYPPDSLACINRTKA